MNIKTPPPVSADILKMAFGRALLRNGETISQLVDFASALQSARDQQWIEMVRPVVEAAERGLEYVEAELQQRKELYEPYGIERKWATEQRDVDAIRAALSQIKG